MTNRFRIAAVLALTCGAALPAAAQCNLYRANVPDFDQKRDALPGDGGMYCVPTSATNWAGYIANHGWPLMMGGPRDWQSNANYNFVTSTDATMGSFMSTSASGGTTGGNGLSGLQTYLFIHGPGLFNATVWYGNVTPLQMYFQMGTNGLVNICYGYYKPQTGPGFTYYTRDGGHCVTLNGLVNVCSASNDPIVKVRNPADDSGLFTQSIFTTVGTRAISQSFKSSILGANTTLTRLADFGADSTTRRYVDTMYVIRSAFCCWAPASTGGVIKFTKAISLVGDAQPQTMDINLPNGELMSMAIHPDQSQLAYVRRIDAGPTTGPQYKLSLVNLADNTQTELMMISPAAAGKTPIAFSRFGELYICDGSVLKAFDLTGRVPVLRHSRTLTQPACSMVFDDTLDELVVLTPANRRLIRCTLDLADTIDEPLPSGVPAIGDGSVMPDPATGKYIIAISGDPHAYELGLIPGSPRLELLTGLLLPAVQSIRNLQPGDGGSFFALCDGSVRVLDRDPTNAQLRISPNQVFNTLPPMNTMCMSRSRTNFNPAEHTGDTWRNLLPEEIDEGVVGVPDCNADFNQVNGVTVQDIFDFLTAWLAGSSTADFNELNGVTVQDIFDFLTAWLAGC